MLCHDAQRVHPQHTPIQHPDLEITIFTTAKNVVANGLSLGEMHARLLQKIEDLTLYTIQLKKEAQVREKKLAMLEKAVSSMYQSIERKTMNGHK